MLFECVCVFSVWFIVLLSGVLLYCACLCCLCVPLLSINVPVCCVCDVLCDVVWCVMVFCTACLWLCVL